MATPKPPNKLGRYVRKTIDAVAAPTTRNRVADKGLTYGKPAANGVSLDGRNPSSKKDITHVTRKISAAELEDIKAKGYAIGPRKSRYNTSDSSKWWSPADEEGNFGREWNKGGKDAAVIRAKRGDLPKKSAVRASDLELKNPKTGAFEPLKPYRGAVAKTVAKTALRRAIPVLDAGMTGYEIGSQLYDIPEVQDTIARTIDRATGLDAKAKRALAPTRQALSPAEYAATTRAKREGMREGKQFVKQPESVAKKTAKYR